MYLASRARRWMWTCTNPTNYPSPTMTLVDHHAHRDLLSSWRSSSQYHMRLHECQRGDQRRKLDMTLRMVMLKPHTNAAPGERCADVGFNTFASTLVKCLYLWRKLAFRN